MTLVQLHLVDHDTGAYEFISQVEFDPKTHRVELVYEQQDEFVLQPVRSGSTSEFAEERESEQGLGPGAE